MATIGVGVAKRVIYKKESTFGTAPGTGSAQYLRRVTSMIDLTKDTYKSNEIRGDYQVQDFRHGVRRVKGSIKGELTPGTYKDFIAAFCRQAFAQTTAISAATFTIATGSIVGGVQQYTLTRSAGSYLNDGLKAGDVWKLTAGSFNAANLNKNLYIVSVTSATIAVVIPLNGVALVAEGPIATATLTLPGKKCMAATSSQTDDSFSIEHFHADVSLSELYRGCKVDTLSLALPPSGIATVDLGLLGQDVTTASSQYYVSPTAETTSGALEAVNGALYIQGLPVALLTGLSLNGKANMSGDPVVGSNTLQDILEGRIDVDGSMTVQLLDATFRDYFINETEVAISAVLTTSAAAAADFVVINLPRVKCGGANKDDGEKGIVQTIPFTGLINSAGGTGTSSDKTTICFQDSQA